LRTAVLIMFFCEINHAVSPNEGPALDEVIATATSKNDSAFI